MFKLSFYKGETGYGISMACIQLKISNDQIFDRTIGQIIVNDLDGDYYFRIIRKSNAPKIYNMVEIQEYQILFDEFYKKMLLKAKEYLRNQICLSEDDFYKNENFIDYNLMVIMWTELENFYKKQNQEMKEDVCL